MSLVDKNELFQTIYMVDTDNTFEALNNWSRDANKLCTQYRNCISNAEALSSTLTNTFPQDLEYRKIVADVENKYVDRYINEVLSQIDDVKVKASVLKTLSHSRGIKDLEFIYLNELSESQRSRVRILCRMIWGNLYPMKGE